MCPNIESKLIHINQLGGVFKPKLSIEASSLELPVAVFPQTIQVDLGDGRIIPYEKVYHHIIQGELLYVKYISTHSGYSFDAEFIIYND